MSYAFITKSVGKNGTNLHEDVMSIQIRLCRWIMEGKLPNVAMLACDGDCGAQTKKAIGAFQKLYLGTNNPDCRVDPNGKTLDALFQSLVSKKVSDEAYQAWLKAQSAAAQQAPSKPDVDWDLSAKEVADIRREWGEEMLAWARLPPNGTESMEFRPLKNSDRYVTVFGWKSLTPNIACVANPKERIQFLAMIRDDMSYWLQRTQGNQQAATILQYNAACAVRDYRGFIFGPPQDVPEVGLLSAGEYRQGHGLPNVPSHVPAHGTCGPGRRGRIDGRYRGCHQDLDGRHQDWQLAVDPCEQAGVRQIGEKAAFSGRGSTTNQVSRTPPTPKQTIGVGCRKSSQLRRVGVRAQACWRRPPPPGSPGSPSPGCLRTAPRYC